MAFLTDEYIMRYLARTNTSSLP